MRNIPQLNEYSVSKENIEEFKGLDHNERTQSGEWYDMENMTCDDYPVASTRNKRLIASTENKESYKINGYDLITENTVIDACAVNNKVALLKSADLQLDNASINGKILTDINGDLINISKKEYTISDCKFNNLWWEFEKNYVFFSDREIICEFSGRQYKRDKKYRYAICAYVTTTEDAGNMWTYPLIISEYQAGIDFSYYSDIGRWLPVQYDSANCYTDEKGKQWYYIGNAAAMPGNLESTCGRAKKLGTFDTVESAVKALVDIYYAHFGDYNNFWGYSPLIEYPCSRKDNRGAWASVFKGVDADKACNDSQVYMSYTFGAVNEESYSSYVYNFASYFYENGTKFNGYDLTKYDSSDGWKSAMEARALEKINNINKNYIGNAIINGEKISYLRGQLFIFDCEKNQFKVFEFGSNGNTVSMKEILLNSLVASNNVCFYVNGSNPRVFHKQCATPVISGWMIDENNYITLSNSNTNYDICAPVSGSLSEDIEGGNITIKNNEISLSNIFGINKNIESELIKRYDVNQNKVFLFTKNVNPKFIYDGQNNIDHTETVQFTLQNNGYNTDEVTQALGLFDRGAGKRSMISSGTNLLIIPDGVIVDIENNKTGKIAVDESFSVDMHVSGYHLLTYAGTSDDAQRISIGFIGNAEGWYRVVDNRIQQSISSNGSYMWVNINSFVCLTIHNELVDFTKKFKVGDTVEISFDVTGNIDKTKYTGGLLEYSSKENKFKTKTVKISKVEKDYIDFENTFIAYPTSYDESGNATRWTMGFWPEDELGETNVNITIAKKFPSAVLGCESQNRIWLAQEEGHEIYASALGDPTNFYDYSGLNTDSYAVNVGTSGKFTGVVNYLGTPLFFKENALHIVSGSLPSEYYVSTITEFKGCEEGSENSFAIINSILYYKSPFGVVAYDGGSTTVISEALGRDVYKNGIAGTLGNKYYISLYNSEKMKRELFCYDTTKGLWTKENDEIAVKFISLKKGLVYVTNNSILEIVSSEFSSGKDQHREENFDWYAETGTYGYSYPNKKYISRFQIRMYLAAGSKVNFYIQYNSDGVWRPCGSQIIGKGIHSFLFPIRPQRCDHMKLKIEGNGQAKIYSITKLLEEGGDI